MPRIQPVNHAEAAGEQKELLDAVKAKMNGVPNIIGTMAHSPAVLKSYLGFSEAMGGSSLSPQLREQIALAVAGANQCHYCGSAHTALAKSHGLKDEAELQRNLLAESSDAPTAAVLRFARAIVEKRGWVDDADIEAVRHAGYDDAGIAEIVATVAINTFTNYFNHVADTENDFPPVELPQAAAVTV